jgi:hypothetical protein
VPSSQSCKPGICVGKKVKLHVNDDGRAKFVVGGFGNLCKKEDILLY